MELIASLSCMPGTDLLQWCGTTRFVGVLTFRRNERAVRLWSAEGRILEVSTSDPLARFGRHLYSQGLVQASEFDFPDEGSSRTRLGEHLVELGALSRREVRNALVDHAVNTVCSVALWKEGVVFAQAMEPRPPEDIEQRPLDPFFAVMEAARRHDELTQVRTRLPHDNVELALGEAAAPKELPPAAARIVEILEPGDTVGTLYRRLGGDRYLYLTTLAELATDGAVRIVAVGSPPAEPPRRLASLVELLLDEEMDSRLKT